MTIHEFKPKDPHLSGEAHCIYCDHKWTAVAPVGTTQLECPECRTLKGVFTYPCEPEGERWECQCGCQLFWITPTYSMCYNCGEIQSF